jgi:hypothetical protein
MALAMALRIQFLAAEAALHPKYYDLPKGDYPHDRTPAG